MVVVSVALLVVGLSFVNGIFGEMLADATGFTGHVRVVANEYAQREELLPLYANLADAEKLARSLEEQPGVRAAEPRIVSGVTVTVGQEIGDVFGMVVGASERFFRERLKAKDHLVAGAWFTGAPDEIVAGRKVVEQAGAKVGDELVLLGVTQDGSMSPIKGRLVGVVHGATIDQQLLVPLERVQFLTDIPGGATEILLFGDDLNQAGVLAGRLRGEPQLSAFTVQAWSEREPWRGMTGALAAIRRIIVFIIGLLTALGIWNTMTMSVLERTNEIGVLRAMGMSRPRLVSLVVFEAVSISVVGGALGALLGMGPAWVLATRGIHLGDRTASSMAFAISETVHGRLDASTVVAAFLLGLAMALFGSVVPALRAASIPPSSAMRSGR